MIFETLGLSAPILRAIQSVGYTTPTPIQQKVIPLILSHRDVLARAQTGTGKTAAFVLPLLQRLLPSRRTAVVRALILTPTRELAAQVEASVKTYGAHLSLKSAAVFGGMSMEGQIHRLRRGVDILIATPGRLLDHSERRTVDLSHVEILVLDEADRMLDMGFIRDIRRIITLLQKTRQNLLFSATYSAELKMLATSFLCNPVQVEVASRKEAEPRITQVAHPVDKQRKRELLAYLISFKNWQQVLVFVRTKRGADRLARQLNEDGLDAMAIHGDKTQGARARVLAEFKAGKVQVLVATDIAARGLDIHQLPHVINFDLPNVAEDYIHRIGRTGRAGYEGAAISLVSAEDGEALREIERLQGCKIPSTMIPGFEVEPWIKTEYKASRPRLSARKPPVVHKPLADRAHRRRQKY